MLDFIHHVHEIRPVQEQTPDAAENRNLLPAVGMNGPFFFDDKSAIVKKELLTGIFHYLKWYQ